MILEDLILTYKALVVLIGDASISTSNTRNFSSGFGFWDGSGSFGGDMSRIEIIIYNNSNIYPG